MSDFRDPFHPFAWYGEFAAGTSSTPASRDGTAPVREQEIDRLAEGWHNRRRALVDRLEAEGVQINMWPAALRWPEDACLDCEAWLARGPAWASDDFPAVLRALAEGP